MQGEYSSRSYLNTIEDYLPTIWPHDIEFMYNNSPVHTPGIIESWFYENGISFTDWAVLTRFEPC